MPAQLLVMCGACGRPQFAVTPTCVSCGATLPETQELKPKAGRDKILDAYEPFLEANVRAGCLVRLSEKRLEWRDGVLGKPALFDLPQVGSVTLAGRPMWEALIWGAVAALGALWMPWPGVRIALGLLTALTAAAALLQKRYALRVQLKTGDQHALYLGIGRPSSALARRVESIWASLTPELERLGVRVAREGLPPVA